MNSDPELSQKMENVSRVSAMFSLLMGGPQGEVTEASVNQRARFYRTMVVDGLIWPEDWDDLSLEEKSKRLDKMDELGLKQGNPPRRRSHGRPSE